MNDSRRLDAMITNGWAVQKHSVAKVGGSFESRYVVVNGDGENIAQDPRSPRIALDRAIRRVNNGG
ncbi:hypothetical protein AA14337_3194 [Acetobacter malorum DSM 14337]|uniref:Uncharacterized protein n=1 Tax=Acetobacter malorum DSM 14337 TaxID=1307910 RepID=A0ABQ0Q066_9PROT|nr:hypothetical protein [Acetobacter malorum]KXV05773.1 hypothetical protein AD930_11670 [Acetobacter malorum]GBQ85910.1 hypothetical protein AA14337_3194 [Acetobacter malorum DSM 14337]